MVTLLGTTTPVPRRPNGKLPARTVIGGYPIVYFTENMDALCVDCANRPLLDDPAQYARIHEEGEPYTCEECGEDIHSAYGDPDTTED